MIICKIGSLNNLGDERPKFERLVRGLMVENKVYAAYFICLTNKELAAQKFLGDRERSLPNLCHADLA